uniref:Uncharacterized protein n=1 Tax=Attheya septentrionalis TaxID=420275 RepID=A0A7S2U570_9STRA
MGDLLTTTSTSSLAVDSSASVASTKSGGARLNQRLGHLPQTPEHNARAARRLCLSIRAVVRTGIIVSISGGDGIASALSGSSKSSHHLRRNYEKMLNHASNPFELSASNTLLAATVMCAERRCDAVVHALHHETEAESSTLGTSVGRLARTRSLPDWMRLSVECGTVSVAAQIISHGEEANDVTNEEPVVILFRLACDSRTGRFVPVFPRTTGLLRKLACNSSAASDVQALRQAAAASVSSNKRRTTNASSNNAFKDLTGRIVRDSFDGLSRSMDILARRAGIGGGWQDNDKDASKLRERAIGSACTDVRTSLMTCCGIAAVYGVGAIALGVASGVDASADIAGGIMDHKSTGSYDHALLSIPPVGILLNQSLAEKKVGDTITQDDLLDERRKVTIVEREVLALTGSVNDSALTLHCFDVTAQLDSPSSVPVRTQCVPVSLESVVTVENGTEPVAKRARLDTQSTTGSTATNYQMMDKVQQLAAQLQNTLRHLTE